MEINKDNKKHLVIEELPDNVKIKRKPMPWVARSVAKKYGMIIWKPELKEKIVLEDTLPENAIILDTLDTFEDLNI